MMTAQNRLYHDPPSPDSRLVSDHISELTSSMKYSLSGGLLKRRRFSLAFERNIFNFLFKEFTGKNAKNKPGKLYERKDFPHFPHCNISIRPRSSAVLISTHDGHLKTGN